MDYPKIFRLYQESDDLELEFRFVINNRDMFRKLIQSIDGKMAIEQSINFLTIQNRENRICKLSFVDGEKKDKSYMLKKGIYQSHMIDGIAPYKIVLSRESDIDEFDINLSTMARVKLRLSIWSDKLPGWRCDFTLVKSVYNIKNDIKTVKNKMLFPISTAGFAELAPWDYSPEFELEIEYVGDKKKLTSENLTMVIEFVYNTIDPRHKNKFEYQKIIYQLAEYIVHPKHLDGFRQSRGIRDLYNQVLELNRLNYFQKVFPNIKNYFLLDKADGVRALLKIEESTMYALTDELKTYSLSEAWDKVTVFDAEYIKDTNKYYVFDVLVFKGKNLTKEPTSTRVSYIHKIVDADEHLVAKNITSLTDNYKKEISRVYEEGKKTDYYIDGIIFTPKDEPYKKMKSWKWKPLHDMSIDFLVKSVPAGLIGVTPYTAKDNHTMMFLFCGINKQLYDKLRLTPVAGYKKIFPHQSMYNYFPIQFSPSDSPFAYIYYHPNDSKFSVDDVLNKVAEFRWVDDKWDLMRIRTDRTMDLERGGYFGNSFYVAEYTWLNYQNPLNFGDLIISNSEYMDMGYFKEEKAMKYKPVTAFNSFVKGTLINKYKNSTWLVDLAAGKGQDVFRVSGADITNALFIDSDSQALSELISRKHDFQRGIKRLNTRIFTKTLDLNNPYETNIDAITRLGVPIGLIDVVMCNFALHYLISTPDNIRNIIHLVKTLLKPGGAFFFTSFDGRKVFDLLKDGNWDAREGEVLKYSIKKKYSSDKLEATGQQIDVMLPFSRGECYTECLVNYEYVLKQFTLNGFIVEKQDSFQSLLPMFKKEKYYKDLTTYDKQYIGLYSYVVLKKRADTKSDRVAESLNDKKALDSIINSMKQARQVTQVVDSKRFDVIKNDLVVELDADAEVNTGDVLIIKDESRELQAVITSFNNGIATIKL